MSSTQVQPIVVIFAERCICSLLSRKFLEIGQTSTAARQNNAVNGTYAKYYPSTAFLLRSPWGINEFSEFSEFRGWYRYTP